MKNKLLWKIYTVLYICAQILYILPTNLKDVRLWTIIDLVSQTIFIIQLIALTIYVFDLKVKFMYWKHFFWISILQLVITLLPLILLMNNFSIPKQFLGYGMASLEPVRIPLLVQILAFPLVISIFIAPIFYALFRLAYPKRNQ